LKPKPNLKTYTISQCAIHGSQTNQTTM